MSQAVKTLVFVGVALVVALVAVLTYPRQKPFEAPSLVGKPLFTDFTDPDSATALKIVKFSEDVGELNEFEVARDKKTGLWSIPSSSNYPADAETQMRDAATGLIDLQVIGIASELATDHEIYGVVEPDKETLDASQAGVGLLITVGNSKGEQLAELIIGKEVKGTEEQRFVRVPDQNPVYVVKIDPSKFPTEFDKWIEQDLLKLNAFDVEKVVLKDYSMLTNLGLDGLPRLEKFDERLDAALSFNSSDGKWELDELTEFPNGKPTPMKLLESEELDSAKLNDLKTALDDLKIVGVVRKPKGLGGDLKAGGEFMDNNDSRLSLMKRGFFPVAIGGGEPELRAANGEVQVGTKDSVEYLLRFGEIARSSGSTDEGKLNRYLFVTTRLEQSKFPPLELESLPEIAAEPDDEAKQDEAKQDEAKQDEPAKDDTQKDDAKEDDAEAAADDAQAEPKDSIAEKSELELERERIRKENQRKQDERDEALKKARQKVAELNARFADWYYIIDEDEYKKIHLSRNDLIKETDSSKEEGFGVDALRKIEGDGLKEKDDADAGDSSFQMPQSPMGR